jgi:hypothetical protein
MTNKVLLKKSSVAAKAPLTTDLEYGELAINYADEKLYFKNSSNVIKSFSATGGSGTVTSITAGTGLTGGTITTSGTIDIDTAVVATLTGTQTLTNKTLTDSTTYFQDEADNTKKLQFQLSGITTATTRTLTAPDASGTIALTSNKLSAFAATTSAELAGVISDETGSGALVFGTSPAITTSLTTPSTSFDLVNTTATTVNFANAATTLSIGASTGTTTINNDIVVAGNLTVNGTTTTLNTTNITVDDITLELGVVTTPTDVTAAGGGIILKGATDKTITWGSANGWTSTESFNLASGKTYKINGNDVLSGSTLGSGVTASSLTSVGTITSGTWSGSFGAVSGANLTSLTAGNLSGTIPSAVLGNSTTYVGTTAVALNRASANLALTGISSITLPGSSSGTVQIVPTAEVGTGTVLTIPATTGTIVTTGDSGTVTSTMIADGTIVNADINASAAIAVSKLAASTISGVTLGNNLNALTIGTGLSGTSYNGSGAVTIAIDSTVATLTGSQTLTNKSIAAFDQKTGSTTVANNAVIQASVSTTAQTAVDTFATATYRSAKYIIQVTQGTNYQVSEIMVIHNGTTTTISEYAMMNTNGSLATFATDISSGNVRLLVTMGSATAATINIARTTIVV